MKGPAHGLRSPFCMTSADKHCGAAVLFKALDLT